MNLQYNYTSLLSPINPLHALTPYCLNTLINVSVPSMPISANWFPLFHFLDQKCWPLTLEDGTVRLYWNAGKKLPFYSAWNPKRAQMTTKEKTHSFFTPLYSSELSVQKRLFWQICTKYLASIGPCIVIYFYSKTKYMHQCIKFILFLEWHSTCFGRSFCP